MLFAFGFFFLFISTSSSLSFRHLKKAKSFIKFGMNKKMKFQEFFINLDSSPDYDPNELYELFVRFIVEKDIINCKINISEKEWIDKIDLDMTISELISNDELIAKFLNFTNKIADANFVQEYFDDIDIDIDIPYICSFIDTRAKLDEKSIRSLLTIMGCKNISYLETIIKNINQFLSGQYTFLEMIESCGIRTNNLMKAYNLLQTALMENSIKMSLFAKISRSIHSFYLDIFNFYIDFIWNLFNVDVSNLDSTMLIDDIDLWTNDILKKANTFDNSGEQQIKPEHRAKLSYKMYKLLKKLNDVDMDFNM